MLPHCSYTIKAHTHTCNLALTNSTGVNTTLKIAPVMLPAKTVLGIDSGMGEGSCGGRRAFFIRENTPNTKEPVYGTNGVAMKQIICV